MQTFALIVSAVVLALAQSGAPPVRLSNPAVEAPPVWTRVVPMPDGRKFVSDGALALDAELLQPASMPTVAVSPRTGENFVAAFEDPSRHEARLSELRPGSMRNTFAAPDGTLVNGNYVTLLRRVAPGTRLRLAGARDLIVLVLDGRLIGVVMPVVPPAPK